MAIPTPQRLVLYQLARDHWLEAHGTVCAYVRHHRRTNALSAWLRYGTIISAVITAASTFALWPNLTVVAGILTAGLAAVEQVFAPSKASQAFWDCRTQLEGIKKDIVTYAISMEAATDLTSGVEPLNQISKRLTDGTKVPFEVLASDRDLAQRAFDGSVLAAIISRYESEPDTREDAPAMLGFDAPDIVAVSRKPGPAQRGEP